MKLLISEAALPIKRPDIPEIEDISSAFSCVTDPHKQLYDLAACRL